MTTLSLLVLTSFWASSAFAGDAPTPAPADAVDTEGIVQVPDGSVVTLPGKKPFTVTTYSYLLPEPMYDKALSKSRQLDICLPALDAVSGQVQRWVEVSDKALSACEGQFSTDAATVEKLEGQVRELETRAVTAEDRLRDVRVQRNTAWAITGGLVLGALAVTAVAIGS